MSYLCLVTSEGIDSAVARLAKALAEHEEVRLAYLFGSRARGGARKGSDFDIAVLLEEGAARAERGQTVRRLAGWLGHEVSSELVDLVILNDAPALLRHRVLRDGIPLLERSPEERVRFAVETIRDYQDRYIRRNELMRRRIDGRKAKKVYGGSGDLLEKARGAARLLGKARRLS